MKNTNIILILVFGISIGSIQGCSTSKNKEMDKATHTYPDNYSQYFNVKWASDKLWDDGLAEVAVYKASKIIYGKPRPCEFVFATVKEHFNKEYNVKTDSYERDDLFELMKVNIITRIQTDNYPYQLLTSIFTRRNRPYELYKMTNSSQEWCGNTFKEFLLNGSEYHFSFNSYFDGEGKGVKKISSTILFADQLSYTLRCLNFEEGLSFDFEVAESQMTNHARIPKVVKASIKVTASSDSVENITGGQDKRFTFSNLWLVTINYPEDKSSKYWFTKTYPNYLVKMVRWDGTKLLLKSLKRYPYWKRD